jgi:hypothetical protein
MEFSKKLITNPESESAVHSSCASHGCVLFALFVSGTSENSHGLDKKTTPLVHDNRLMNGEACGVMYVQGVGRQLEGVRKTI